MRNYFTDSLGSSLDTLVKNKQTNAFQYKSPTFNLSVVLSISNRESCDWTVHFGGCGLYYKPQCMRFSIISTTPFLVSGLDEMTETHFANSIHNPQTWLQSWTATFLALFQLSVNIRTIMKLRFCGFTVDLLECIHFNSLPNVLHAFARLHFARSVLVG